MNDAKLKKIFELSRAEAAPVAPEGFDAKVMSATRREQRSGPDSVWDVLERLFPRLAVATVLLIGACILTDVGFSAVTGSSMSADVNEISEHWLFAAYN